MTDKSTEAGRVLKERLLYSIQALCEIGEELSALESFEESLTEDKVFHGLNGEEFMTPMMSLGSDASFLYYQGEGFQAVDLPYLGY